MSLLYELLIEAKKLKKNINKQRNLVAKNMLATTKSSSGVHRDKKKKCFTSTAKKKLEKGRKPMKNLDLIKVLNDNVRYKDDPVRNTMKEMDFSFSSNPGKTIEPNDPEIVKLADQLRDEVLSLSPDAANERIAADLEMLEYSPEEIDRLVPQIANIITNSNNQ